MPLIEHGPLAGNYLPNYDGQATVNLLSSLIHARGGRSPHSPYTGLDIDRLSKAHCILYVVFDGLGLAQLNRHLQRGQGRAFFANHAIRPMSTVYPATTAAAVTTFDSGASPAEHAVLSWYLHLPDLGTIATVLRTTTRLGTPLVPEGFDLREYFQVPSYVESVATHRGLLSFGEIPNVPFCVVGTRWRDCRSYLDLDGLINTTVRFAREPSARLGYVYWPRYDGLCHEVGCEHPDVDAHFDAIDQALADLTEQLRGTQTTMCILADHGLIDVSRDRCIDLAHVPGLMECLATAPAGDQRQQSCFVRPAKVERFLAITRDTLGEACKCISAETLLNAGVFGPGDPHPALAQRLGDFTLLCNDGYSLVHTPPGFEPSYMQGSHGGMSEAEIQVPLIVVEC